MAGVFEVPGFGFQFDYNGELVAAAARQAMRDIAATNAISIVPRIFTQTSTSNDVLDDPAKTESMANLTQVGSSVFITLEDGSSIEIQRANLALFGADDFAFV